MKYNYTINPSNWGGKFITIPRTPKVGEDWWCKIGGNHALSKVTVTDITPNTVEVCPQYGYRVRYETSHIDFVEKINHEVS